MDIDSMRDLFQTSSDYYNMVVSKKKLSIDSGKLYATTSKKAIEAAMHPDDSKNLYFVATGNGGHKFTASLEEHNRAVQEYLTVLRSKKNQGE